ESRRDFERGPANDRGQKQRQNGKLAFRAVCAQVYLEGGFMNRFVYQKFIRRFLLTAGLLLLLAAAAVIIFDPFYHYHGPVFGLKAVVTKSEYQCIGTIRNFEYDSVLCGSSTAENYNNRWLDEIFDAKTVKAIKSSGTTADLKFYLDEAFATHEVKNVFYSLDLFALDADPDTNFVNDSMPLYLYDRNWLNDVKYIFNKDVLFEDIPYLLAMNFAGNYDEGESYNWWQYMTFSREEALKNYVRSEEILPMLKEEEYREKVDGNLALIGDMIEKHPETNFYFFLPPYSMLWWDRANRSGQLEEYLYAREALTDRLLSYENVKLYDFQSEDEIILNLDNYMDPVHFSPNINHWMVEEAGKENSPYQVTKDNREEKLTKMEELTVQINNMEF
ncbi:MAG: hypothetical protein Q4C58_15945, partial [Eubacteriales bacterium]|nr:hypothetical protein [Eubacteriales bacterium]